MPNPIYVCVNGTDDTPVRGPMVMVPCLDDVNIRYFPKGPSARFPKLTCSNNGNTAGERIAQARFIQWLDAHNRDNFDDPPSETIDPGSLSVHPGVQWEIATSYSPAKYADVLNYKPNYGSWQTDPSDQWMTLWELKTSVRYDSYEQAAAEAASQAWAYMYTLKYERVPDKEDPDSESLWKSMNLGTNMGYNDAFTIEMRTCNDRDARGRFVKTAIDHEYQVLDANTFAGAIVAARTVKEYRCSDDRKRENEVWKQEDPYEAYKWWRWRMPEPSGEPEDPNYLRMVPWTHCTIFASCTTPPGRPQQQESTRDEVVVNASVLRTDLFGREQWQEQNPGFCEAVAEIERRTSQPRSTG